MVLAPQIWTPVEHCRARTLVPQIFWVGGCSPVRLQPKGLSSRKLRLVKFEKREAGEAEDPEGKAPNLERSDPHLKKVWVGPGEISVRSCG